MAGKVSFNVSVLVRGADILPELVERAKDLRPAFENIVKEWARDNEDKFKSAVGQEAAGTEVDPGVFWKALTPGYMQHKRKLGYPNALMHATGALEEALTDPERFFQGATPSEVVFGTPLSPEEEAKAYYNRKTRQVIFLSVDDQRMIDNNVGNYFNFGEDYKEILFARGVQAVQMRGEVNQMNLEFNDNINSPE